MIDLNQFTFADLWEGPEFVARRGMPANPQLARIIAVAAVPGQTSAGAVEQLEHEFRLAPQLDPAWALQPLALAEDHGRVHLILADPGGDFLVHREMDSIDAASVLALAMAIANALGNAHRAGLVHGDLRPRNVMRLADGSVRLTGFQRQRPGAVDPRIQARADLHALGVMLKQMLPGKGPEPAFEAIVNKLLGGSGETAYLSCDDLQTELRACLPPPVRRSDSSAAGAQAESEVADIDIVLKAAQALSSETLPAAVIDSLMRMAIEHAGARRGALVVMQDGAPRVVARAHPENGVITVEQPLSPSTLSDLPEAALRQVLRTGQRLIEADAGPGALRPGSVLCLPILKRAQTMGALYLESDLAAQAISPTRLAVLEFLAVQAALTLENATLDADLRRGETLLTEGQRLSKTGTWRRNLQTGKLVWSKENSRIFGHDPTLGEPPEFEAFKAMIHPEDLPRWLRTTEQALRDGSGFEHEFRIVLADGNIKHVHTASRPIVDDNGRVTDYIGTTMDITERKRQEDSLRDAQSELARVARQTTMGELAASIAHEVNQPLAAIVANAETSLQLLSRAELDLAALHRTTQRIVRDGRHAADVIRNIRALMRKSEPEATPLLLDPMAEEVLALMRSELRSHAILLQTALGFGHETLFGDRVQLQQVFVNLIRNGIEAMDGITDRPRELTVRTARHADGGAQVSVEDNGTGITQEAALRMYEPFYSTKLQGMGMGLAICRSIVDAHGGRLTGFNRLPHGSVFQFTLPAARRKATTGE